MIVPPKLERKGDFMKAFVDLNKELGSPEQVKQELKTILNHYEQWLSLSGMSEKTFLEYSDVNEFVPKVQRFDGYVRIRLFQKKENRDYSPLGEMIVYPVENEFAKQDAILLLLYISSRLDENGKRGNFFVDIMTHFVRKL